MNPKKFRIILFIGIPLVVCCWILFLFAASGYQYESAKVKGLISATAFVLLFQFVIADPIKFVIQALWQTFSRKDEVKSNIFRYGVPRALNQKDDIRFFQMRVGWNKSRLTYDWRHRDEALNLFYRNIATDLLAFGRFFIMLMCLTYSLHEPLSFYHSDNLKKKLSVGDTNGREVETLEGLDQLYEFLNTDLIDLFDAEKSQDASVEENCLPDGSNKLIGVIRMQQVRLKHRMLGQGEYIFVNKRYFPGWMQWREQPYQTNYWRTYDPWIPNNSTEPLAKNDGYFSRYPLDKNYVVMFTRSPSTNREILEMLRQQRWLDRLTAALYVDFILYNADINLFAKCRISAEHTPYGSVIMSLQIESDTFLITWNALGLWDLIVFVIYIMVLLDLLKILVLKMWYGSAGSLFSFWNFLDLFIVIGNIFFITLICLREVNAHATSQTIESASKEEYINFHLATIYGRCANYFHAFLVFAAFLRLWKVLLFARVFRLCVRILELGAPDFFWALVNVLIFLVGLMISSHMVNSTVRTGSHSPLSVVHILSFSLGYSEGLNPMSTLDGKTSTLRLIFYALMMFGVTLVLLNMLITLICIHYAQAKEEERAQPKPKISFWEFLYVEYSDTFLFFVRLRNYLQRKYRNSWLFHLKRRFQSKKNKTGIARHLQLAQRQGQNLRHATDLRRIRIMTDILMTQNVILNRRLKDLNIDIEPVLANTQYN